MPKWVALVETEKCPIRDCTNSLAFLKLELLTLPEPSRMIPTSKAFVQGLGQGFSEQAEVSSTSPEQLCPFPLGGGLVQDLSRALIPPPHDLEHWVQLDQSDHPPSTSPAP